MNKFLFSLLISALVLLLSGCQLFQLNEPRPQSRPVENPVEETQGIEARPQITSQVDWNAVVAPLIKQLLLVPLPIASNTLLVSDVKNNTGEYIPYQKINQAIIQELTSQGRYKLIDKTTVNLGKQALGLPYDDTLVSRSKMIALGRYLGSDFVLFSSTNSLSPSPDVAVGVSMELLSTKTGEIIWRSTDD